jgi:hypothetical protein
VAAQPAGARTRVFAPPPLDSDRTVTAWIPLQVALADQGFPVDSAPYDLGMVSFHNGWTFHRAEENCTATPRRVMTMIYIDADIRVAEPVNEQQRIDRDRWLGGAAAGQVPDGGMNPVLFTH